MKKETLRAVTMLVSIIALAFVTAIASSAQARGKVIRADIPFDFVVGDKTLAAGKYSVSQITSNSDGGILVKSRTGSQRALRLSNALLVKAPREKTSLTFTRYGNTYFLSQVWLSGASEGREVIKSKKERAVGRELAGNSSQGNPAQDSRPEVVTIIATVE